MELDLPDSGCLHRQRYSVTIRPPNATPGVPGDRIVDLLLNPRRPAGPLERVPEGVEHLARICDAEAARVAPPPLRPVPCRNAVTVWAKLCEIWGQYSYFVKTVRTVRDGPY